MTISKTSVIVILLKLAGKLPLGVAQAIGRFLGRLGWWLPTEAKIVTKTNLAICYPELDTASRRALAKTSLRHTGETLMEIPLMWEWPVEKCLNLIQSVEGTEHLQAAVDNGQGLILLAPHLGSLITLLRDGGVVGILPDQSPRGPGNAYAPFFGMEVRTMTLVSKLAQKSGAKVLATYAERLPDAEGFRIVIRESEPGIADPDPVVATTALNKTVEHCVRETPAQYQWEYKRLRHRPEGEVNPYKKQSTH